MAETTRYGICTNKTHCSYAFNREPLIVPPNGACPECGRPLKVNSMFSKILRWMMLLIILGGLGVGGIYAYQVFIGPGKFDLGKFFASLHSSSAPGPSASPVDPQEPQETPALPPGPVSSPKIDNSPANARARSDVLKRIELMPNLTDQQRNQLRKTVTHARTMGCVFVIPFENGQRVLSPKETEMLVSGFQTPSIQNLQKDGTAIFVVLGYADRSGDAAMNNAVSADRAHSVAQVLENPCGVTQVNEVAMGGSNLFDGKSTSKNRLVEIWVGFP